MIIGLALQDTLGNFAKGLMILINRPFDEGDYVDIGSTAGTVQSASIVATTIVRADNRVVVMPNHQVWGGVVVNLTARATRRVDLVFSISYEDDINHAIHVLWAAVAEHPLTLDEPEPTIAVVTLGDHSVDILCAPWCRTQDYLAVQRGLTADLKQRFDATGITMPYPQRDLHVHAASGGDAQPGQLDTRRKCHMAWVYLIIAGVFEWGWPVGLKLGLAESGLRWGWIAFSVLCMAASGALLLIAQKSIPMGTAYAVWTGIGAVGAFVLGLLLFAEPATLARFFFVGLIVAGIVGLKLVSAH